MSACTFVCVYLCVFLDADQGEELVVENVFLARKLQLFANCLFCHDYKEKRKYGTHLKS